MAFKRILFLTLFVTLLLPAACCYSEEAAPASAEETIINHYREIIRKSDDPAKIADAYFEIGLALEKLGRETEATAEYLKIVINYPERKEAARKAEERLAGLYSGFSVKSEEFISKYAPAGEEKDPTVFFAYIKGLYENYRNLGQYEKALKILRKLYDMDPENENYLIDIGDVYLQGYNDFDKAIFHFEKAIRTNPANPKAYIDLAKAHEAKGDYEGALRIYSKATELFPASPWTMYGLKRTEGIRLAKDKRLVKDWLILGPFDNSDRKGLAKTFPPEEKRDPKLTSKGKDNVSIVWFRPFTYEDSGYVDLNTIISPHDYALAFALTYVYSSRERKVDFRLGSDSGIRISLNGEAVYSHDGERLAEVDDDVVEVLLKKGWNEILLKISETWGSWGFYFRITDLKGNPVEDLIFDPMKNERRLREIYGQLKKKKRLKITGFSLLYTGAVSIFLAGLYFMISNILNRVKINRMKEDFVSSVSHELKTPISAIKMLAETLAKDTSKEARKEDYCNTIIRESDRLTRFINKILDFSKLEEGSGVFRFEKEDLAELAEAAIEIYKNETEDPELKIRLNADEGPVFANVDKDAVLQAVLNLIDNAYKYSQGKKEISVNVGKSGKNAFLDVIDKGPGIPKGEIKKIFEKFYRIEEYVTEETKGSGLGLAFSKGVIKAHGGTITCESKLGEGSKFTITLPALN